MENGTGHQQGFRVRSRRSTDRREGLSRRTILRALVGGVVAVTGVTSAKSVSAEAYSKCVSKCAGIGGRYCTPHTLRCYCDSIGQTYCYCYNDYAQGGCDPYNSIVYDSQIHCRR